jgi:signal peptidase I
MAPSSPSRNSGIWSQLRSLLLVAALALLLRWAVVEPRWIPSESMLPNLQPADRVLVFKLAARLGRTPGLGSVVVFHTPEALRQAGYDPNAALIKRVVALPGDSLAVQNGELWRNGAPVPEPWRLEPISYELPLQQVNQGQLLVLGDNRNSSLDSHLWGPLPTTEIIGTAIWRYWPMGRFGPIRRKVL